MQFTPKMSQLRLKDEQLESVRIRFFFTKALILILIINLRLWHREMTAPFFYSFKRQLVGSSGDSIFALVI